MIFHTEEFRLAVEGNNPRTTIGVLGKLILSLKGQRQSLYAIRMMEEISGIIKGQTQSPTIKFKTTKMLTYLIVMADGQVLQLFAEKVYPMVRNACLFNRNQPLLTRGMDFFRNNKCIHGTELDYEIANYEEKIKIKNIGCKYICFCLECVYILSQWLPKHPVLDSDSIYRSSYKMLIKQGVQFPLPNDFFFFGSDKIEQIEQTLVQCREEADILKDEYEASYFQRDVCKFNADMMKGVEYLQSKLREKDKIIQQLKVNNSMIDIQKTSYLIKLQEYEESHNAQVDQYEKKICELNEEARKIQDIIQKQRADPQRQNRQRQMIASLEAKVQILLYQNSLFKEQIKNMSPSINAQLEIKKEPSVSINSPFKSQQHIKELLKIGEQPQQFSPHNKQKNRHIQSFFEHKDLLQSYLPLFSLLSPQMEVRFKKALLKSKQILFKNNHLQIGVISVSKNDIEVHLTLIITNVSDKKINIEKVEFHFNHEQEIFEKEGGKKILKIGEQFKKQLVVVVNSIDGKCPSMMLHYHFNEEDRRHQKAVLLPIGKLKLAQFIPYTSHSPTQWIGMERVYSLQKKILSCPSRLKDYLPKCFVQGKGRQRQYCFKLKLLQIPFFMMFNAVGQESIRILLNYKPENRCLAEKIMQQLKFIFAK